MYRNIIFDLYGTLVDIRTDEYSVDFWRKAVQVFAMGGASFSPGELRTGYAKYVKRALRREHLKHLSYKYIDIDLLEVFRKLYKDKGIIAEDKLLRETAGHFREASTEFIRLYDGAIELLDGLRDLKKRIFLLSNAQESFTVPEMEELGILPYFDGIMISSEERVSKPQRQFFEKLLDKYQPEYMLHGHVHMRYGTDVVRKQQYGNTTIINASERYAFEIPDKPYETKYKNQVIWKNGAPKLEDIV